MAARMPCPSPALLLTRLLRSRVVRHHHPAAIRVKKNGLATGILTCAAGRRRGNVLSSTKFPPRTIRCCSIVSSPRCRSTEDVLVLGIETSCDDTGAAVVTTDGRILGEAIASQAELLGQWGGVVPKLASEEHRKFIDKVVADALQNAGVQESDLSAVAVTIGPGLSLCLHVGVKKARNIAKAHRLPMVGVHHMEAHALVVRLIEKHVEFPFIVLLVSGGHNLLLLAQNVGQYVQLGTTVDDAIGEAYDKTARLLGLDMKKGGGPALEELAREGDPKAIKFSVPMRGPRYLNCNFSYAGLKNQVRMAIEARNIDGDEVPLSVATAEDRQIRADIAASFQRVAVQHLEDKCRRAVEWARRLAPSVTSLVVSGGVASNHTVRSRLGALASELDLQLVCPPPRLCTDNGVMVAWAGVEHLRLGMFEEPPDQDEPDDVRVDLRPRWQLGEIYEEGQSEARSLKRMGHHQSLTAQVRNRSSEAEGRPASQ
ncbi:N6-L-threonylcarbamoyladenine synthase [Marchantia polymorpha subsp. ruderalis]|uniref:Glycoprotease 1 n=2 Tax=Marchantia polymorpha TaxID=3197 RepID=A0AAF6APG4_MARPO|nr:hypothetical protein MARPO_0019s0039 [Marchantia polymorpha]BBM98334.1 hypothetical protein Mp_1g12690 [Marchantia polymorpha subsp. ruderalis]|eukprot:PTQ44601.1 hypothetical protein MARPO_0019s0039 [Marchantia polymorpha]